MPYIGHNIIYYSKQVQKLVPRRYDTIFLVFVILLAATVPAWSLSTLLIMPTAHTLKGGKYNIDLESEGVQLGEGELSWALNTKVGVTDRLEAGVNIDLDADSDTLFLFKAKYSTPIVAGRTELGVGVTSVGHNSKYVPYTVISQRIGGVELHAGIDRVDCCGRLLFGVDGKITPRLAWMADINNGEDEFSSTGMEYTVSRTLKIRAGAVFPNNGGATTLTVQIKYVNDL